MSRGGAIAGVLCFALFVGVVVLSALAWGASARREREIEGGPRR